MGRSTKKLTELQKQVAEDNYPLAIHTAKRLFRELGEVDYDDILSAVVYEYMSLVLRFNPERGSFGAHAWHLRDKAKRRIFIERGYKRVTVEAEPAAL